MGAIRFREVRDDVPEWQQEVADAVEALIRKPNGGCWPVSLPQLKQVASVYGRRVRLQTEASLFPAFLADELILVYDNGDEQEVFARIVHELSEYLLISDEYPQVNVPGNYTAHQIAQMVDGEYRVYLTFHRQMEEILTERKARRRRKVRAEMVYEPLFE